MITVTTFKWVPDFARGQVRDLRVRWALEEAGLAYAVRQISFEERDGPDYRACQPFGQVPVLDEDGFVLFESGAVVLHVGARSEVLLPADAAGRARAVAWVFAALNTMEVAIQQLAEIDLFHAGEDWAAQRRPGAEAAVRRRLADLATWLGDREHLEGRFTAGDLMMASVLRILNHTDLVTADPVLGPYLGRCEARPAFRRALRDHLAAFG